MVMHSVGHSMLWRSLCMYRRSLGQLRGQESLLVAIPVALYVFEA